jgi:hypothetical protein
MSKCRSLGGRGCSFWRREVGVGSRVLQGRSSHALFGRLWRLGRPIRPATGICSPVAKLGLTTRAADASPGPGTAPFNTSKCGRYV